MLAFDRGFDHLRTRYGKVLAWCLNNRPLFIGTFTVLVGRWAFRKRREY